MVQVFETGDTYAFKIDVAWWVCSRNLSLSFAEVEALSDGLPQELAGEKKLFASENI